MKSAREKNLIRFEQLTFIEELGPKIRPNTVRIKHSDLQRLSIEDLRQAGFDLPAAAQSGNTSVR